MNNENDFQEVSVEEFAHALAVHPHRPLAREPQNVWWVHFHDRDSNVAAATFAPGDGERTRYYVRVRDSRR